MSIGPSNRRFSTASTVLPSYSEFGHDTAALIDADSSFATRTSTLANEPPSYSSVLDLPDSNTNNTSDSETGSKAKSSASLHHHDFHLKSGKDDSPWATLKVFSKYSVTKCPRFYTGDNISGVLQLYLKNPVVINSMTLSLRGLTMGMRYNAMQGGTRPPPNTFLNSQWTIWSRSQGDPYHSMPTLINNQKFEGKLEGEYSFPYDFPFPSDMELFRGEKKRRISLWTPLPQSFLENGIEVGIWYELVLCLNHGTWRTDSKLTVPIMYIPKITPEPASLSRNRAYFEGTMPPVVAVDPNGWLSLQSINIGGKYSNDREVELKCILSLAKPVCYTRGSVIPCHLTLSTIDTQALNILANPNSLNLRLIRRLKYFEDMARAAAGRDVKPIEDVILLERAVWWVPPKADPQGPYERQFQGEIHLSPELQPSSDSLLFGVEYFVELMPFVSTVFRHSDLQEVEKPLLSYPVKIATFYSPGPRPTRFTSRPHSVNQKLDSRSIGDWGFMRHWL